MLIEVREEQEEKAPDPILVTLLGIVMEVRAEQPEKAYSPMLVTPLGMATEVREEQSLKVPPAINRVFSLITYIPEIASFASIRQLSMYNTSFSQFDSLL